LGVVRPDLTPDLPREIGEREQVAAGVVEVFGSGRELRLDRRERDSGNVRKAGPKWTVAKWLTHWVETIAAPSVRYNTMVGYRAAVYKHLIPGLGAHRLDRLEPEHLERLYARMMREGAAAGTAHQTHRTIKTALNQALRRGHVTRNVASLAKAPGLDDHEIDPFTVEEAQCLLGVAAAQRNGVRFALALALGLRKGEALGLRWNRVDSIRGCCVLQSNYSGKNGNTVVPIRQRAARSFTSGNLVGSRVSGTPVSVRRRVALIA
jgi:integrase